MVIIYFLRAAAPSKIPFLLHFSCSLITQAQAIFVVKPRKQARGKKNRKMSAVRKSAAKKKSTKASGPSTISLVLQAIGAIKSGNKGASRAAIANWILANSGKTAGGRFNAVLRRALASGLANGVLIQGATNQRFKLGAAAKKKAAPKKKKAASKKKKSATKKRKTASKKKKAGSRKKKAPSKKKTGKAGKRKKTASKKKKTSSRRK